MCALEGVDEISGKACILLNEHEGPCRVDTPLLGSSAWDDPWWRDYAAVHGQHVTRSE